MEKEDIKELAIDFLGMGIMALVAFLIYLAI